MRNVTSEEKASLYDAMVAAQNHHSRALKHADAAEYNAALAAMRQAEKAYKSCKVPKVKPR